MWCTKGGKLFVAQLSATNYLDFTKKQLSATFQQMHFLAYDTAGTLVSF